VLRLFSLFEKTGKVYRFICAEKFSPKESIMKLYRKIYKIEGIIQGVGFRPAVYGLAINSGFGGWIMNCSGKVLLAIEGEEDKIDAFMVSLPSNLPVQAKIDSIQFSCSEPISAISGFRILESERDSDVKVSIPADLAMCTDCEKEITDPLDRRYKYSFTTCVNCGPRYTVVNSMPYDRCRTTLSDFPLCDECEKEYTDPNNRRFHAESTACPVCGPRLFLSGSNGDEIQCDDPLGKAVSEIADGKIVAVRGIGGFLLAVDAFNKDAVSCLRTRKRRPDKPFAVMAKDMSAVKKYCRINDMECDALQSVSAPIVIVDVKDNTEGLPMDLLSPDTDTLGVMLPYSPLHRLLFYKTGLELLIMTSGNKAGEPICITNEEAFERLSNIADCFLCHNREINLRNDDSLCTLQKNGIQIWRRARGFAPEPIKTDYQFNKTVLAMGAELKNCIALADDKQVVVSPHIGDLETPEALDALKSAVKCFPDFLNKEPDIIAVDLHPDMHSTRIGMEIAGVMDIPVIKVQHHQAHAASCMAEYGLKEALALVFDGTGLGTDGTIWGAEALYLNGIDCSRYATFNPVPLPGGDAAVYQPKRQLAGRFKTAGADITDGMLENYGIKPEEYEIWSRQCDRTINAPLTHAAGRLFDSFAVCLGISPSTVTYEGQGAIRLESEAKRALCKKTEPQILPFRTVEKNKMLYIDWNELFLYMADKNMMLSNDHKYLSSMALSFHKTVAAAAVKMLDYSLSKCSTENIILSGGVFMNKILTCYLVEEIESKGLNVNLHRRVPPNDGGIALGQAVICNEQLLSSVLTRTFHEKSR
jgi:hydrogenase maturation protein HypF